MDDISFDRLTRGLAAPSSRRRLARALVGLPLLALFGSLATQGDVRARKKRHKKRKGCKHPCGSCKSCKQGKCVAVAIGTPCEGGVCLDGVCDLSGECAAIGATCESDDSCCTNQCGFTGTAQTCRRAECLPAGATCSFELGLC